MKEELVKNNILLQFIGTTYQTTSVLLYVYMTMYYNKIKKSFILLFNVFFDFCINTKYLQLLPTTTLDGFHGSDKW
jgi:hypothetical protein